MKKILFLFFIFLAGIFGVRAQGTAQRRAAEMGAGMNLSYLDNYWKGTKEKHFSDFVKPDEAAQREKMFVEIAAAGFKTVRIPICFSAWMELKQPYNWENEEGLKQADLFVKWALANNLKVIIDLHHTEFDNSIPEAIAPERIVNLWLRIAERYKNTDPEKVFFELRNEPHDITAEAWRWQAGQIIKVVREVAPSHTLIVGFQDWNSRAALTGSKPFADQNMIYTFHYYDPFIFTHQGATWASKGLADLKNVPFPASNDRKIETPAGADDWVKNQIKNYQKDSQAAKMYADLKTAKDWAEKNNVPIFLGEFGSYDKYAAPEDRCRHAAAVYSALGKLQIPNAWWEWDGGFNMFDKGTTKIMNCMQKAIDSYSSEKAGRN